MKCKQQYVVRRPQQILKWQGRILLSWGQAVTSASNVLLGSYKQRDTQDPSSSLGGIGRRFVLHILKENSKGRNKVPRPTHFTELRIVYTIMIILYLKCAVSLGGGQSLPEGRGA